MSGVPVVAVCPKCGHQFRVSAEDNALIQRQVVYCHGNGSCGSLIAVEIERHFVVRTAGPLEFTDRPSAGAPVVSRDP